jgi:transposase
MPRHLQIEPHLSLEELEKQYRQTKEVIEKTHYQVIWLLASGKSTSMVAEVTGYSRSWIYELVRSYNRYGASLLGDQRRHNQGAEPLLNDPQQALLWQALQEPPEDGGLWSGPKVARWMSELLGRKVSPQRGWEYLKGLEYRLRRPRPHHEKSSWEEQEEWKKKLATETQKVREEFPDAEVEVWAQDEHRLGLKPVLRAMWVPRGEEPIAKVNWRFEWLWLYGFVHPESGETYWWLLPYVETELFNQVLADFAHYYGLGPKKRVILAMDRAGWHPTSEEAVVPEGIHIVLMPAHSPELQPAERLWPLVNEPVANRSFKNLDELEEVVYRRCQTLFKHKDLIRGLTNFYWWPRSVA